MRQHLLCFLCLVLTIPGASAQPSYLTYFGGSGQEGAPLLVADREGSTYIAGKSSSPYFPTADLLFTDPAYLAKFDKGGKLVFGKRLRLWNVDALSVDEQGNVYVAGKTGLTEQATAGAYQTELHGESLLLMKLRPDGTVDFATYFGLSPNIRVTSLAISPTGNPAMCGTGSERAVPVTRALENNDIGSGDAWCSVFSRDGSQLLYATMLPGKASTLPGEAGWTEPTSVAFETGGDLVVGGWTLSPGWPAVNAFQSESKVRTLYRFHKSLGKWEPVASPPAGSRALQFRSDGTLAVPPSGALWQFALHPLNERYACITAEAGQLRCTSDGLQTWRPVLGVVAYDVIADPTVEGRFFVAGRSPGLQAINLVNGKQETIGGLREADSVALFNRTGTDVLLYATWKGALWRCSSSIPDCEQIASNIARVYTAFSSENTLYGLRRTSDRPDEALVFRSDDGGRTWNDTTLNRLSIGPFTIKDLAVDPNDSSTVYVATDGGVFRSADRGQTWEQTINGLVNGRIRHLKFDQTGNLWAGAETLADGFVLRIRTDTSELVSSTLLGGEAGAIVTSVKSRGDGVLVASGTTVSRDFPVTSDIIGNGNNPFENQFVSELQPSGELSRSHLFRLPGSHSIVLPQNDRVYIGGSLGSYYPAHWVEVDLQSGRIEREETLPYAEAVNAMHLGSDGKLRVAGTTRWSELEVTTDAWQSTYGGWVDAYWGVFESTGPPRPSVQ